jgi:uncharacterized protein YdiU (UPF0061 family)
MGKKRIDFEVIDTLLKFENSFSTLPEHFYSKVQPQSLSHPYLVSINKELANELGIDPAIFKTNEGLEVFTGNKILKSSIPISTVYSGHQFGHWAGQLGDGRAILLGDLKTENGTFEIQLKGAGLTPYSRRGDGRAVLRSSIREYLCSEAMNSLGVPTTRALCITGSDDPVYRERVETASVVTRVSPTFIRFGSFEHWYYKQDIESLKILTDYTINTFYPELKSADFPYKAFLSEVIKRTAELMAQWQAIGFMHGVMNTDNMSILGLTIDYGPFGFMDAFNQGHICNHSDDSGRYSYVNQPHIGNWNCKALAQALLPLLGDVEEVKGLLESYWPIYRAKYDNLLHQKLGLEAKYPDDSKLIDGLFSILQQSRVDLTLFFRRLSSLEIDNFDSNQSIRDLFIDRGSFDDWSVQYRRRLKLEQSNDSERKGRMNKVNPKYILRNYLLQIAIEKAENGDFSEVDKLLNVMKHPFDEQIENELYAKLPPDWASDLEVSCSS